MKSGHLIECNMINTFLKKSYTHCAWEKLVPDPIFKNKTENISGSTLGNVIKFFSCMSKWTYAKIS